MQQREEMLFDVVIVGAGPAGLSAAIKIRQLAIAAKQEISVCVVEKGSEVGSHILSGAVIETKTLDELFPDWQKRNSPLQTQAKQDKFCLLFKKFSLRLPTPPQMQNHGNYIVSLSNFCKWLGKQAEDLGVQIFAGFAASDAIIENGKVCGIITGDFGVGKDGSHKASYQQGVAIRAKVTLLSEGCRGSLSERIM
ncbi:MAG: NAD(P)/FAD-dependent oxidoreductase, partial [Pseudomonadota bacterium]